MTMSNIPEVLTVTEEAIDEHTNQGQDAAPDSGPSQVIHSHDKLPPDVRPYAMMTRTCYVDFDPMNPRGRLPGVFGRSITSLIGNSIILQDINFNQIQVSVERKNLKVYLTNGWSRLRDFYGLTTGGWVVLTYINPFIFYIRVRKITGLEVQYPKTDPPCSLILSNPHREGSWKPPVPFYAVPTIFAHKLEKTLTASDVNSGSLVLYWRGFCEFALPKHEAQLTLIDWRGYAWRNCPFQIENTTQATCRISGQWRDICKAHRLTEGITIKFGVTEASNNTTLYFKLAPFLGVKTTMYATTESPEKKIFYETQHYYML